MSFERNLAIQELLAGRRPEWTKRPAAEIDFAGIPSANAGVPLLDSPVTKIAAHIAESDLGRTFRFSFTVDDTAVYTLAFDGLADIEYTTSPSDTVTEIIAGLKAAKEALGGDPYASFTTFDVDPEDATLLLARHNDPGQPPTLTKMEATALGAMACVADPTLVSLGYFGKMKGSGAIPPRWIFLNNPGAIPMDGGAPQALPLISIGFFGWLDTLQTAGMSRLVVLNFGSVGDDPALAVTYRTPDVWIGPAVSEVDTEAL